MKLSPRVASGFAVLAIFPFVSCSTIRNMGGEPVAATEGAQASESGSALAKLPKLPKLDDLPLAHLLPGRRVAIAEVREKDLRELPSGRERAMAFENERKSRFWVFGGPVKFKEPSLPEAGAEMDGSLLPPRVW